MNLPTELAPSTLLQGKFKITKTLGQGGFGITYKAENISLGNTVCIKELFIGGNSTRGAHNTVQSQGFKEVSFDYFKKRFIDEARGLAKFNHPGIVRVTDVFEENETAYFVMEFVHGQTLKEMVAQQGALPTEKAIALILHLLDAVEAVHSQGMLHRDIKPDNILITPEGKSVLIDFGSARQFAEGYTTTQTAILTPGYAPLEQYSDKAKRGPFTDIYALGATIYFILTGVKPIAATDRGLETLSSPETLNPAVSKTLASVVMLAMNLKPEDRFQTIAQMREALQHQASLAKPTQHNKTEGIEGEQPMPFEMLNGIKDKGKQAPAKKSKTFALIVVGLLSLIVLLIVFKTINVSKPSHSTSDTSSKETTTNSQPAPAEQSKVAEPKPPSPTKKTTNSSNPIIGQSIKLGNLEITQYDLSRSMSWDEAKAACAALGNGWRLPTGKELYFLYENRDQIGGFTTEYYWSSSETNYYRKWCLYFADGFLNDKGEKGDRLCVRAVRTF